MDTQTKKVPVLHLLKVTKKKPIRLVPIKSSDAKMRKQWLDEVEELGNEQL